MGRTKGTFGGSSPKGGSWFAKGGKITNVNKTKRINPKRVKKTK